MITDGDTLVEGEVLEADVCIVGSGPAGMSLALALEGRGLRVLLLEAGGREADAEAQAVYAGESALNVREGYADYLTQSRARVLGGTSSMWSGWCRPLQPEDFEVRPWVPYSGWPVTYAEVAAYYEDASGILDVGPLRPAEDWLGSTRPPLALDHLETRIWQFSGPTRFATKYRSDLEASEDIEVVLDANLVGVLRTGEVVEALELSTLSGRRFEARAPRFVLATGGIENARLLLALDLGNDLTGRFFQEHPSLRGTMELALSGDALSLYTERGTDEVLGTRCMGLFAVPGAQQAAEGLLNQAVMLRSVGEVEADDANRAVQAWMTQLTGRAPIIGLAMAMGEQTPNPDSRVTLVEDTDRFGMRRARLDWNLLPEDWTRLVRSLQRTADGLAAAGVGRGRMLITEEEPWPRVTPGMHAMGTTRMAADPADGVVDPNGRVFGLDNLYVAGSSVFPTGGAANPTLTIVALALRLADHLAEVA